jgi:hypothetical protein
MRRTFPVSFLYRRALQVSKPPLSGYEVSELPDEHVLQEFVVSHKGRLVMTIVHSGRFQSIREDPLTRQFISRLNGYNFGNPEELAFALVPGPSAKKIVDDNAIITYPTTLLMWEGGCFDKVVGARPSELSVKCLFKLRNEGRNIFPVL